MEESEEMENLKIPCKLETPEDVSFEACVSSLSLHPQNDIFAAGDLDGDVFLYSYSCFERGNRELWSSGHHQKACRDIAFSPSGRELFSTSKDKAILLFDVELGRLVQIVKKAHDTPIYSLLVMSEHLVATGDDSGTVRLWDFRHGSYIMSLQEQDDYISCMAADNHNRILLATSGDGTLCSFNIRRRRFDVLSEPQDGDLTSVVIMKEGQKVVCGSAEGRLHIFNWDGFGVPSDHLRTDGPTVDCLASVSTQLLCAGAMDGVIRAVSILPNRVIGALGQHLHHPVECLAVSHDSRLLASAGHDQRIKFWSTTKLRREKVFSQGKTQQRRAQGLRALSNKAGTENDFFSELGSEPIPVEQLDDDHEAADDEEDCDSDSDA
uniref:WD repeat domain 55 n=1 Tax=Eptatretus burgeri TaxID=7764 RepID=A0A8C4R0F3_EPTBU